MSTQYSPDGRWHWDGSAWQPVLQEAARPEPRHRWRPGRKFYLPAVLSVALAALLVSLVVRGFISGFPTSAIRVTGPGTAEVTLTAPGSYTISYERQATGNAGGGFETGGQPLEGIPAGTLKLVPATSGAPVDLRAPSTTFTYFTENTEGQAIAEFVVDHPGTYRLTSQYSSGESGPQFTLAIAHGSPSDTVGYVLGGLAAVVLLLIGVGIAIGTFVLRVTRRKAS
jgi:hypothetical protein